MPTIVTGARDTASSNQGINSDRRIIEMHNEILLLEPDKAPLTLFSSMVSRKAVGNPEFKVLEDELVPHMDRVNNGGGYTAGDLSIVVDNGAYFHNNSLVRVQRTGEVMFVSSVSSNTLTVTRSWGATAAAALVDNDQLTILGGAAAEGAASESSKTTKTTTGSNYTQIFRWPFQVTRTENMSDLYGGNDLSYQRRKAAIEFAKRVENAFFFGEKAETTAAGTVRRSTGGIDKFISTNSQDFGGTFNLTTFMDYATTLFRYGSKDKVAFVSRGLATNIALEGLGMVEKQDSDTSLGMNISRLVTPHGRLRIISHDMLEGDTYGGYGFVVDLENLGYRFLKGSDTKLYTNIQANDVDGEKDEYLGEIGFWRSLEKTHGRIKNAA